MKSDLIEANSSITETPKKISIQEALIEIVQRPDIDPDRLEKFLDLQIKMEERQAEKDFNIALNKFQRICPIITKTKKVSFKSVDYDYAPLDEIVSQIKPLLHKTGLSYSFDVEPIDDKDAILYTTIQHVNGFKKTSRYVFSMIHNDERMNISQRRKSAMTQAKREGLEDALGIVTTGKDDDGRRAIDEMASDIQMTTIRSLMATTTTNEQQLLEYIKLPDMETISRADAKRIIAALEAKRGAHVSKNTL